MTEQALIIVTDTLAGPPLDYWVMRSLDAPAEIELDQAGQPLACWMTDREGRKVLTMPSRDLMQAGLLLGEFKFELRPPLQAGEPWEAWFDPRRIPGAPAGAPTVKAGKTWMQAVCRAKVAARYGDTFDPTTANDPPPAAATGSTMVHFGTPTAIQRPAGAAP